MIIQRFYLRELFYFLKKTQQKGFRGREGVCGMAWEMAQGSGVAKGLNISYVCNCLVLGFCLFSGWLQIPCLRKSFLAFVFGRIFSHKKLLLLRDLLRVKNRNFLAGNRGQRKCPKTLIFRCVFHHTKRLKNHWKTMAFFGYFSIKFALFLWAIK